MYIQSNLHIYESEINIPLLLKETLLKVVIYWYIIVPLVVLLELILSSLLSLNICSFEKFEKKLAKNVVPDMKSVVIGLDIFF